MLYIFQGLDARVSTPLPVVYVRLYNIRRPNTMAPQNILLFGATGQIGTFILNAILSARGQFNRIVIFTSPHTAETKASYLETLKQQNVEVIVGNVEDENAVKAAYEGDYPSRPKH